MWMVVLMWPLVMYLRFTDIERWEVVDIPWVVLVTPSGAVLALVLVLNAGVAYIHPFFTSISFLLTTPFTYGVDQILSNRQVYDVEFAGASVAFAGALILVLADVSTRSLIRKEWNHTIKTARFLKKATERRLEAKLETKIMPISSNGNLALPVPHLTRLQSVDPVLEVTDLSKTGVYRRTDSSALPSRRT
ncbi:hypothetical protein RvY_14609-1 [Ramazzottius varieornatus]|uniref:Uncharacterized protein n=1 Tax=Ramazzottius varieornatus TaxID=947166 RepID=A0A1D1VRW3_RAMVA|nr:hypothetical protein RvY_14609-1 [Ramazzottius varieornatus]